MGADTTNKSNVSGTDTDLLGEIQGIIDAMSGECTTLANNISTFTTDNSEAFKGDGSAELTALFENVKSFATKMSTSFFDGTMTSLITSMKTSSENAADGIKGLVGSGG